MPKSCALPAMPPVTQTRDRPLRGGSALRAVFERRAVLALGGAVVRRGHNPRRACKAAADRHGSQQKPLHRGRAGAVQPEIGNVVGEKPVGRTDALVEQIARKERVHIAVAQARSGERQTERHALGFALRTLPCFLAEQSLGIVQIETPAERSVMLLFADDRRRGKDRRPQPKISLFHS